MLPKTRWLAVALSLFAAVAAASPTLALGIALSPPRERNGLIWADLRVNEVISERVEQSLSRGMPATLQLHAELWRKRGGWFDKLENSYDVAARIRYEVWSKAYRVEWKGTEPVSLGTVDSVRIFLSRPLAIPVGRTEKLNPGGRYFLVVSVTLRPLTVEDMEEGEGWLSGEVENKKSAGLGIITAIPRSVFDAARNIAGLGDERARGISEVFELEPRPRPG